MAWLGDRIQETVLPKEITADNLGYWQAKAVAISLRIGLVTLPPLCLLGSIFAIASGAPGVVVINTVIAVSVAVAALAPGFRLYTRQWLIVGPLLAGGWLLTVQLGPATQALTAVALFTPTFAALVWRPSTGMTIVWLNGVLSVASTIALAFGVPIMFSLESHDASAWAINRGIEFLFATALVKLIDLLVHTGLAGALTSEKEIGEAIRAKNNEMARLATELEFGRHELRQVIWAASHSSNEPLKLAASYASLLAETLSEDERVHYYDRLVDELEHMRRMNESCRTYAGVGTASDIDWIPLWVLLDRVKATHAAIIVDHDPGPLGARAAIYGSRSELAMLLVEPVANALLHNPDQVPRVHLSSKVVDGCWQVSVRDDGVGLEPEVIEEAFAMFTIGSRHIQRRAGLGLARARKIAHLHGGSIALTSSAGDSTTVTIRLPLSPPDRPLDGPSSVTSLLRSEPEGPQLPQGHGAQQPPQADNRQLHSEVVRP